MAAPSWSTCQLSAFITVPLLPQRPRGSKAGDSRHHQQLHLIILNIVTVSFLQTCVHFILDIFASVSACVCVCALLPPIHAASESLEDQLLNVSNYWVYLGCGRQEAGSVSCLWCIPPPPLIFLFYFLQLWIVTNFKGKPLPVTCQADSRVVQPDLC